MTTMTNITSLWHLFVTVLILTERTWSVCGSMELPASHRLRKSRQPSVGRFDSDIGSVALESLMEKSVDRLNLPVDCASAASPMSCKRRSRVLLRTVQNDLQNSRNEVEVLIAFKVGITGDPLGVLSSWRANDSDPCSWLGIACGKSSKRVTSLDLSSLQLAGAVSAVLGQLSFLRYLDLSNNSFTGEIPEALGNCSRLKYLALGQNNLQGGIPSTLGNCSSLTQLSLESNPGLGGELPLELGNLILLQGFTIHNCSLQGSFPTWLLNFTDMQDLDLGFNQFSGDIPPALGKISKLYSLNLEGNSFTGEIPVSIGLLGQLQEMYLDDNELSGEIPTSIGNITYLLVLCLFNNNLTGEIPRSIVNTSLQSIQIHQNQLTGELPHDIGLLSDLEFIRINNNALSGSIPSSISNCTSITYLSLGVNAFSPQVFPSWILPLTGLTEAYFPQMNLQGAIPEEIGQLSELSQLSLYSNNLTGVLPSSLGNCTSLRYLDITSNAISGKVPPELGLLSGMISFLIGSNNFSPGPFPTFLYNFTMITQLEVSDNEFTGMLDGDFGRFAALNEFNASHNKFQGPVPSSFSNCSNLNYIDVGQNYMSGDVPGWLFNLTNLRRIGLSSNKFSGVIPVDFGSNFQLLEELDLSDNNLEGTIPVNMGRLVSLEYVYLQANNFTGVLPHALANCTHLIELDISQNKLSGDVSGDAFPTTPPMLTKLNLSHNLFSGSWPSQFSLLTSIQVIDVSHNRMSGPIPLGLANCFILQSLDVSFNMFNGSIPQDLALLTHLTTFNASYNNFVGPIPDQGIFGTNLTATSFLGDPGLCGPILGPQRQCPTPVNAPQGSSHCTSFKCTRLWIPLFSVLGTVFFLITVLLTVYYCRGKKKDSRVVQDDKLEMYIVNPRMVFLEKDLLAAIAPGQGKVIGTGAKSIVYKAVSPDDDSIAIKVLRDVQHPWKQDQRDKDQWEKEIMNEVRTLGQLRHRNIIKIFTLCFSLDIKAIVLEYMPNGSLHGHLHDNGNCDLTWAQRFRILLGVTHGLVYLHHEFSDPIIHRDLKASNILLDEDLEPKLCDFGISKFVTNEHGEATATAFCGTFGYIPPEYGTGARLSTKGDVYSYGVVLLELLSAKEATEANRMIPSGGIVEDRFLLSDVQAFELLDPTLKSEGAKNIEVREQMLSTMRVGHSCTNRQPESRPTMSDVLLMLLEIQQI